MWTNILIGVSLLMTGGAGGFLLSAIIPRKSAQEQLLDDEAQMEFLREYRKERSMHTGGIDIF